MYCDVIFKVGMVRKEIKVYKYVLVSRSYVFEVMLFGDLLEINDVIDVLDIEVEIFDVMLRFEWIEIVLCFDIFNYLVFLGILVFVLVFCYIFLENLIYFKLKKRFLLFNVVNKILKLGMIFLNLFFRFLYFEEVEINENLVIGIIYVVEKYGIIDLLWKCEFFF